MDIERSQILIDSMQYIEWIITGSFVSDSDSENENKDGDEENKVDIEFDWKLFKSDEDVLLYDGPGGILGKGGNGFVHFDLAERWYVSDMIHALLH